MSERPRPIVVMIRDECHADIDALRGVIDSAFGRRAEADLVDRPRIEGDVVISLVATEGNRVIGHVLFSTTGAPFPTLGLAPISVAPEHQRLGVGRRLVRAGLERAETAGWRCVFVLGDPAYHARFGFNTPLASGFESRYAGPHLLALAFGSAVPAVRGEVDYAPAFQVLG